MPLLILYLLKLYHHNGTPWFSFIKIDESPHLWQLYMFLLAIYFSRVSSPNYCGCFMVPMFTLFDYDWWFLWCWKQKLFAQIICWVLTFFILNSCNRWLRFIWRKIQYNARLVHIVTGTKLFGQQELLKILTTNQITAIIVR